MTKKLLIDLWASATSHLVVAEWPPSAPGWFESGMVIILTGVLLVRFFRNPDRRPQRESASGWTFSLSIKRTPTKPVDPPANQEVKSSSIQRQNAANKHRETPEVDVPDPNDTEVQS